MDFNIEVYVGKYCLITKQLQSKWYKNVHIAIQ